MLSDLDLDALRKHCEGTPATDERGMPTYYTVQTCDLLELVREVIEHRARRREN
jgi:hypothetical protein